MTAHLCKGCITNKNSGGGNKKKGLVPRTNTPALFSLNSINRKCGIMNNNKIYLINTVGFKGNRGIHNIIDYNMNISTNFSSGQYDNIIFNANNQLNILISSSGTGIGIDGGYISQDSSNYSTPYYVHFSGGNEDNYKFKPISNHVDIFAPSYDENMPQRYLMSNNFNSIINTNKQHIGGKIINYKIKSIIISYITGTNDNGGDRPDMHTWIKGGKLTAPENLYLEFFNKDYDKIGDRITIWQTKEPLNDASMGNLVDNSGVKFRWKGYNYYRDNFNITPPFPNGTPYVAGQGSNVSTISDFSQVLIDVSFGGIFYDPSLNPPYIWNGTTTFGPYNKPLLIYPINASGDSVSSDKYTFSTQTFNYNLNNTLLDGVTGFRIFQDRYAHPGDEYGIRYIKLNIDYSCIHKYYIYK